MLLNIGLVRVGWWVKVGLMVSFLKQRCLKYTFLHHNGTVVSSRQTCTVSSVSPGG